MKLRLPYLVIYIILLVFILPSNSFAQSPTVTPVPTCSPDFLEKKADVLDIVNIVSFFTGLFSQKIPENLMIINQSQLPYAATKGESTSNICQESNTKSIINVAGSIDVAKEYQVARATRVNDGNISVTANLSFFDLLWANTIGGIFSQGNKEADNFLRQGLPVEAAKNLLTMRKFSNSSHEIAQGSDPRVLGIFGSQEEAMAVSLPALQCANLPYGIGDCAVSGNPVNPSPSVYPPPGSVSPTPGSVSPSPGDGGTGENVGICPLGVGPCSVDNLKKQEFFGDEEKARLASQICAAESNSNPLAKNDGCLKGRSCDYSIGLFQINMLAQCKEAFNYTCDWDSRKFTCEIIDEKKLNKCVNDYYDPATNIRKAYEMSAGGTNWSSDWRYNAKRCNIP